MIAFHERGYLLRDFIFIHPEILRSESVHIFALLIGYRETEYHHVHLDMKSGLILVLCMQPETGGCSGYYNCANDTEKCPHKSSYSSLPSSQKRAQSRLARHAV